MIQRRLAAITPVTVVERHRIPSGFEFLRASRYKSVISRFLTQTRRVSSLR